MNKRCPVVVSPCGIPVPADSDACANHVTPVPTASTRIACGKFGKVPREFDGHGLLTKAFLNTVDASNFHLNHGDLLTQLRGSVQNDLDAVCRPWLQPDEPQNQPSQLPGQGHRRESFLGVWSDSR